MARLCSWTEKMIANSKPQPAKTGGQSQNFRRICPKISLGLTLSSRKNAARGKRSTRCDPCIACKSQRDSSRRTLAPLLLGLPRCKPFHCHQRDGRR